MTSNALFVFLSILALINLVPRTSALGFSVELIHRDHPKSPLYNPNLSHADRVLEAVHRSNIRATALTKSFFSKSFGEFAAAPTPSSGNIQMRMIKNTFTYLTSINVGTPAKEIIAIADTGSDLIWVTCEPCTDCYQQDAPRFDPSASFSYSNLNCTSPQCIQLPTSHCDQSSNCTYLYGYIDGSQTRGNLGQETLTFNTTTQSTVKFLNISFGCSHQANGSFDAKSAGLVGLAAGPLSLISQLGSAINHRFSYCLVPLYQANVTSSKLSFGSDAIVSGAGTEVTDMVDYTEPSFYTVTLDGITVGDNNTLGGFENPYYMVVDSGTFITRLDQIVLDSLIKTLSSTIRLPKVTDNDGLFPLCFNVSNAGSGFVYPDISLKLGNATLVLKPYNAFIMKNANVICLAMKASALSILGNMAQTNFHVGYDLGKRKISFAPVDCTKF